MLYWSTVTGRNRLSGPSRKVGGNGSAFGPDDHFALACLDGSSITPDDAKPSRKSRQASTFNLPFGAFQGRFSQSVAASSYLLRLRYC